MPAASVRRQRQRSNCKDAILDRLQHQVVTALAVMQLVEAGQIELDVPVAQYLPDFRTADVEASSRITVRHFLNQTSGFSRADGLAPLLAEREQSLAEAVHDLSEVRLNRPVGESYQYSNLNFVVLGYLVETIAGQPWTAYVQANIFDPLGMANSFTSLDEAEAQGLTATHRFAFGFPLETRGTYLPGLAPTGYLYSTAEDMARYLSMYLQGGELYGERLLSEEGIAEMLAPATNEATVQLLSHSFRFRYAQGWFAGPFGAAGDARWHQGSLPYFAAWMVLLPDADQSVVVLINANSQLEIGGANSAFSRIPIGVVNLLRGEAPPSGISTARFYLFFNAIFAGIVAVQAWSLARLVRRAVPSRAGWRSVRSMTPLLWEVGLSLFLLVSFPAVVGGGWRAAFSFLPDLSLAVAVVAILWLVTGMARIAHLVGGRRSGHRA